MRFDWLYRMGYVEWALVLMVAVIVGVVACAAVYS